MILIQIKHKKHISSFHNDARILSTLLACERKCCEELFATTTVSSAMKHFDAILETYKIQKLSSGKLGQLNFSLSQVRRKKLSCGWTTIKSRFYLACSQFSSKIYHGEIINFNLRQMNRNVKGIRILCL